MNQTNLMHLSSYNIGVMESLTDYQRLFINNKIGVTTVQNRLKSKRTKVLAFKLESLDEIWQTMEEKYDIYSISTYKMYIIDDRFIATLSWHYESTHIGLSLTLSSDTLKNITNYMCEIESLLSPFIITEPMLSYTIIQNDNSSELNETFYQESVTVDFNPIAMPFIDDVESYIDNFLNSKAPVLILQGEPGTGKSTFVKYLLKTMKEKSHPSKEKFNVLYSFDEEIFYLSDFYKRIIFDDYDVLILEDINQVLHKNQDEARLNPINKFLSVTDGLISKYKKIIITTNIESKHQLNSALLRPGRCYDVIPFRKLEGMEIDDLCDSCAQDLNLQTESINLSEFYAKCNIEQNSSMINSRVGF